MLHKLPFSIQGIQSNRSVEFFGLEFQKAIRDNSIKFRPIRPRSPHLNCKVEWSQKTDKINFYLAFDFTDPVLAVRLEEWQSLTTGMARTVERVLEVASR
jgi:transposase InsO family protein